MFKNVDGSVDGMLTVGWGAFRARFRRSGAVLLTVLTMLTVKYFSYMYAHTRPHTRARTRKDQKCRQHVNTVNTDLPPLLAGDPAGADPQGPRKRLARDEAEVLRAFIRWGEEQQR